MQSGATETEYLQDIVGGLLINLVGRSGILQEAWMHTAWLMHR